MSMLLSSFDGRTGTRGVLTHQRNKGCLYRETKKKERDFFLTWDPFSMLFSATITLKHFFFRRYGLVKMHGAK